MELKRGPTLTGSIASASAEIIQERGTTNPVQALQGSVAGVNITNSTGRVGDSFEFTVRGKSSLEGGNNPLFVVDGVITDNIDFLNPNDIAKIDILKDASSQAIYVIQGIERSCVHPDKRRSQHSKRYKHQCGYILRD